MKTDAKNSDALTSFKKVSYNFKKKKIQRRKKKKRETMKKQVSIFFNEMSFFSETFDFARVVSSIIT